jgi:uncharacterized protein YjbI with pentapeptide repeats
MDLVREDRQSASAQYTAEWLEGQEIPERANSDALNMRERASPRVTTRSAPAFSIKSKRSVAGIAKSKLELQVKQLKEKQQLEKEARNIEWEIQRQELEMQRKQRLAELSEMKELQEMEARLAQAELMEQLEYDGDNRSQDIRDADVRNADIRDADVRNADIRDADVRDADIRNVDMRGTDTHNVDVSVDVPAAVMQDTNTHVAERQYTESQNRNNASARTNNERFNEDHPRMDYNNSHFQSPYMAQVNTGQNYQPPTTGMYCQQYFQNQPNQSFPSAFISTANQNGIQTSAYQGGTTYFYDPRLHQPIINNQPMYQQQEALQLMATTIGSTISKGFVMPKRSI